MSLPPMDKSTRMDVAVGDTVETPDGHERVVSVLGDSTIPPSAAIVTSNGEREAVRHRPAYGWTIVARRGPVLVPEPEPLPLLYTEDDLRLAFDAGSKFGDQERYEDEGHYRVPDDQRAASWEQYLAAINALNGR